MTMFKKSTLGAGGLAIIGLLFVGIMLLANQLLPGARVDLTSDNLYTLSDGTQRIVKGLKEPVNLYFFYSEKAADSNPDWRNHGTRVRELLQELVSLSGGNITLKVIDPQPYSEEEDRASELGINSMPINANGDRLYLGIAATNSTDGKEALPFLDPRLEEQLEYDVAKLIHKLSSAKKPVLGWLSSLPMQGSFDMQTGRPTPPWVVYGQVEQLYTVRNLEPTLTAIDSDVDLLVLVHPKQLPPPALYAIDQFVLRGGHLLLFVDPSAQQDQGMADPGNPMAQFQADRSSTLEPLLGSWGVEYKPDQVVGDLERGLEVAMREGEQPSQHIAILGLDKSAMSKDVITAQLDSVNFATAGSLKAAAGSKLSFEPLVHTSKQAGLMPVQRIAMMSNPASLREGFRPTGELVVAARISGKAQSAFPGGPPAGARPPAAPLKESEQPINVVVVADTDLMSDFMWLQMGNFFGQPVVQPFANNGDLVLNAVDNLGGSNDLASIRARAAYHRPFERVSAMRRASDAKFRAQEMELEQQLQQLDAKLSQLQTSQPGANEALLSPQLTAEIERFQSEKLRIRKELRATKAGLNADIEALGLRLKVINVLLMPLLVVAIGLFVSQWRKRRRHAIAMLRRSQAS
jgi:ABC-type uncharacterized transport system involved in gliding motility auxiliary subunit